METTDKPPFYSIRQLATMVGWSFALRLLFGKGMLIVMTGRIIEANIDSLVGPTHHYSGLGVGNVASMEHRHLPSSPRQAALEGLNKAWLVAQYGVPQFLLPPPRRPRLDLLADFGFQGTQAEKLRCALSEDPSLLSAIYSSSFMWTANAATVTAACDSTDQKLHITVANLASSLHRSIEAEERRLQLAWLFDKVIDRIVIHPALPGSVPLRDEGAANWMRLSSPHSHVGIHVGVHGDSADGSPSPCRYLPRHTLAASRIIQRQHQLNPQHTFHLQQHPDAISEGVFHNDVIATSHQNLLIFHETAFSSGWQNDIQKLDETFRTATRSPLIQIVVKKSELSLPDAVRSYLFNSQLICPLQFPVHDQNSASREFPNGCSIPRMVLVAPQQCREIASAARLIDGWIQTPDIPIDEVKYVDLRQSMAGGGGPACLRLRLPIREDLLTRLQPSCRLDQSLFQRLAEAIDRCYPNVLSIQELADVEFAEKSHRTADIMSAILGFPV